MSATSPGRASTSTGTAPRCAWCGEPAAADPGGGRIASCAACGSATTYPVPSEDELERSYATWYRPASGRFPAGGDRFLAFSRATLARRIDRIAPQGPVLDVGSGDGQLLRALRARGREAVGLERDARDEGVVASEVWDFDDAIGEWAAVVFWHSLEHLRDPVRALDRATELLCTGGVLLVAVPNLSSWQSRVFGDRWFHLDIPRHFVHLPARALAAGLEARGLRIERCSYWRGGQLLFGWLHGMVGGLPGCPDLYSAIRRPEAQNNRITGSRRALALSAATLMSPAAAVLTTGEVAARAGGTVYVEVRRQ